MTHRIITEPEFRSVLIARLLPLTIYKSVIGPGRSGAIASVYASHYLGIPWLPISIDEIPEKLKPVLVIDTATHTGRTIRKMAKRFNADAIALFREPPIVKFWYES